jgi:hypothetical protein
MHIRLLALSLAFASVAGLASAQTGRLFVDHRHQQCLTACATSFDAVQEPELHGQCLANCDRATQVHTDYLNCIRDAADEAAKVPCRDTFRAARFVNGG